MDQVAEEFIEPEGKGEDNGRDLELTVTVKDKEVITPEFIMHRLSDGSPDWQLRLEGMMLSCGAEDGERLC